MNLKYTIGLITILLSCNAHSMQKRKSGLNLILSGNKNKPTLRKTKSLELNKSHRQNALQKIVTNKKESK